MRGFLGFLVFATVLIGVLVFVVVPLLVRPVVAGAVRAALPFGDQAVSIEVDVDGLGLLGGYVDRVRITGDDLVAGESQIGALDVTMRRVGLADRDFASIAGSLESVTVQLGDGTSVEVPEIRLSGPSASVLADARVGAAGAEALVVSALATAGLAVDRVGLAEGGVALELLGLQVIVPLTVVDGAVVATSFMGLAQLAVIAPAADDPWRVTGLKVLPTGLDIEASIDLERALGN